MSSADRLLAVLGLFDEEHPIWTVEEAAPLIGVSISTAYRYFRSLSLAGLLDPVAGAGYCLGPEIIELDRKIRLSDPLLSAAKPAMKELITHTVDNQVVILCRLFRDQVMCVHQEIGASPVPGISYERGLPRSMFSGATSKVILAHMPARILRKSFEKHHSEMIGLGTNWEEFKASLKTIRRQGYCIGYGEVDKDRVGIAAPVMNGDQGVIGSLSIVGTTASMEEVSVGKLITLVKAAAVETSERLAALEEKSTQSSPRAVG